jgi:hypothetical protein
MADTTEAMRLLDQLRDDEYKSGMHRTLHKAQQAQHTATLLRRRNRAARRWRGGHLEGGWPWRISATAATKKPFTRILPK